MNDLVLMNDIVYSPPGGYDVLDIFDKGSFELKIPFF
jgi:hypothetical protein